MKDVLHFTELYFNEKQMETSAKEKRVRSAYESNKFDTCLCPVQSKTECEGVGSDSVVLPKEFLE